MINVSQRHKRQKKFCSGALICLILILGGVWYYLKRPTITLARSSPPGHKTLLFDDEFNGKSLDKSKWNTCYDNYSLTYSGCTNYGNSESEWYTAPQVKLTNGNLVLSEVKRPTTGSDKYGSKITYAYDSGMVSTGRFLTDTPEKWSHTYGYYEARIKAPAGQAVWPAFWLLPVNRDWPPEIDTMELLGDKPNQLLATYVWKGLNGIPARDSTTYTSPSGLADSWHVYAINWQPGTIDWYVDGIKIKHAASSNVAATSMQIIFNLAVGGQLPGNPTTATPAAASMLIDYIRVYK